MKRYKLAVSLIVALCATAVSHGEEVTAEARLAAQHVAVNTCANCHGRQGAAFRPSSRSWPGSTPGISRPSCTPSRPRPAATRMPSATCGACRPRWTTR